MATATSPLPPSKRGLANIKQDLMLDLSREVAQIPPFDEKLHPDGLIDITSSVNALMLKDLEKYMKAKIPVDFKTALPYGATAGSDGLLKAVAGFINHHFHPSAPILPSHVLVTNGVTPLLDFLPFAICDPGDGIMYTTPVYGMFPHDMNSRNDIQIIPVTCPDGFDQFKASNASTLIAMFDSELQRAKERGIMTKCVLICNPCNPLGRAYSRETLVALARWCAREGLHLVSDEIYAMSVFPSRDGELDGFTSVLSIAEQACIDGRNIHVLYGASKDFGLGGLRLGFLVTRNENLKEAVRRLCMFTWVTAFSDAVFTQLLSDTAFITKFFETYQTRLQGRYTWTAAFLRGHGIPFEPANSGLFIWIDLSAWLNQIACVEGKDSPELTMTRWLMTQGIYLEPGEAFYSPTSGRFRLVYTSDPKSFEVGMTRLVKALDTVKRMSHDERLSFSILGKEDFATEIEPSRPKNRLRKILCF